MINNNYENLRVFQGYLKKVKSNPRFFGTTNLRWFELNFDSMKLYYKNKETDKAFNVEYDAFGIERFSDKLSEEEKRKCDWPYGFLLKIGGRQIILFCQKEDEFNMWKYAFRKMIDYRTDTLKQIHQGFNKKKNSNQENNKTFNKNLEICSEHTNIGTANFGQKGHNSKPGMFKEANIRINIQSENTSRQRSDGFSSSNMEIIQETSHNIIKESEEESAKEGGKIEEKNIIIPENEKPKKEIVVESKQNKIEKRSKKKTKTGRKTTVDSKKSNLKNESYIDIDKKQDMNIIIEGTNTKRRHRKLNSFNIEKGQSFGLKKENYDNNRSQRQYSVGQKDKYPNNSHLITYGEFQKSIPKLDEYTPSYIDLSASKSLTAKINNENDLLYNDDDIYDFNFYTKDNQPVSIEQLNMTTKTILENSRITNLKFINTSAPIENLNINYDVRKNEDDQLGKTQIYKRNNKIIKWKSNKKKSNNILDDSELRGTVCKRDLKKMMIVIDPKSFNPNMPLKRLEISDDETEEDF